MDSDELALTELIGKQFGLPPPENNSDPGLVEKWRQAAKQIIRSTVSLYTTVKSQNFIRGRTLITTRNDVLVIT